MSTTTINQLFLAFDFGTKNIGVAIGQAITQSATPLSPLRAKQGIPLWAEIDTLIKEWDPTALIVGVPYSLDGSKLKTTSLAQKFIASLTHRYTLPVYAAAEQLTTKAARTEIFTRGGYKALQKESVDSVAAKLILEEWLHNGIP